MGWAVERASVSICCGRNPDLRMRSFVASFHAPYMPIMDKFRNGPITEIDRRTNINPPINHSVSESVTQAVN